MYLNAVLISAGIPLIKSQDLTDVQSEAIIGGDEECVFFSSGW
jgi:hypothetical protein